MSPEPPIDLDSCIIFKFSDDATTVQCCQLNGSVIPTRDPGGSAACLILCPPLYGLHCHNHVLVIELDLCIILKFSDDVTIIRCCQLNGSAIATRDPGGSKLLMFNTQHVVLAETKTLKSI